MNQCFADFCSEKTAAAIFEKARGKQPVSPEERSQVQLFGSTLFQHPSDEKQHQIRCKLGMFFRRNRLLAASFFENAAAVFFRTKVGKALVHAVVR